MDGVIVTSPFSDDLCINTLIHECIPFVCGRYEHKKFERSACVDIDNQYSGYIAGKYLITQGHRDIGLLTETKESIVGRDFQAGVIKAFTINRLKFSKRNVMAIPVTFQASYGASLKLLSRPKAPTAIIANTTLTVFGAIEAVQQTHKKVTVLGIDSPLLKSLHPALPRIHAPIEELGRQMAGTLIQLLDRKSSEPIPPKMLYARLLDEKNTLFNEEKNDEKK